MAVDTSLAVEKQQGTLTMEPLPERVLGKTGERVPILGIGTGPGGIGMEDDAAVSLYHQALDLGVTYVDTAPGYDNAQVQLGRVMAERRDEVFLVSKTAADDAEKALSIVEQSLKDLRTDHLDLVYVHSMGSRDVDKVLAPDGSLAGLREAQRRGWTRYVGFTAHNTPHRAARMLREAEVDVAMLAMNSADRFTYRFEEDVLPLAHERNVGVAAMKVFGGAVGMDYNKAGPSEMTAHGEQDLQLAMRYALGLPGVTVAVIGVFNEQELNQNVDWAKNYEPLSSEEEADLLNTGRQIAGDWGPHFGSVK